MKQLCKNSTTRLFTFSLSSLSLSPRLFHETSQVQLILARASNCDLAAS